MDGFTYHDIFQTKGIEYLVIIAFLLSLIPFWVLINQQNKLVAKIQQSLGAITTAILKIPKGVFYSRNHTWAFLNKSGIAEVGVDDWLLHLTGQAKYGLLKKTGDLVNKGDLLTEIEKDGKSLHISSPITGRIVKTNPPFNGLEPISQEWIYQMEPLNWKSETHSCYIGEESEKWFKQEMDRFKDFVAVSLGANSPLTSMIILQDGGEVRDHSLGDLSESIWRDFQIEFLDNQSE